MPGAETARAAGHELELHQPKGDIYMMKVKVLKPFYGFQKGQEFVIELSQRAFVELVAPALERGDAKDVSDEPVKVVKKSAKVKVEAEE